jgi:very-short-patch-repair endonuclease
MKHAFARRLRHEQTNHKRKLWYALRDRRLSNLKFRRQQPIGPYVVDFICFETGLVVELDGSQHDRSENLAADQVRTAFLESKGYRVLRFRNQAFVESFGGVVDAIFAASREGT